MKRLPLLPALVLALAGLASASEGYYRFPSIHGDTIVFTAEGDLWRASAKDGEAQRLTTHAGLEYLPALSPDGKSVAFSAQYEGPIEVYVMPLAGGLPKRLTFEGESAFVRGWTRDGKVLYATRHYSTIPDNQLVAIDPATLARTFIPLAQADEAAFDDEGKTIFFTRYSFQGSHAKRYVGGTAQNLWRLDPAAKDAIPYHPDYLGVSRWPMFAQGRVYFASERDGTSNLWSMKPDGSDLKQHTKHADFGVRNPQQQGGRIVYQNGADLWLFDLKSGAPGRLALSLASDFDQTRETWVTKPVDFITATSLSPDGERVALVARGQVFVAPATGPGRLVEVSRKSGVRYRSAEFTPDGKSLLVLSDESGEVEFWQLPANGVGEGKQITKGGEVLRVSCQLSPDGKWIASAERDQELWVFPVGDGEPKLVAKSRNRDFDFASLDWSPDSKWLAYALTAPTGNARIFLHSLDSGQSTPVTSDRVGSSNPSFSPDGKWLYFLSDRTFNSAVGSPWGARVSEPFLDKQTKIYQLALGLETRSPFQAPDELSAPEKKADAKKPDVEKPAPADSKEEKKPEAVAQTEKQSDPKTSDQPAAEPAAKIEPQKSKTENRPAKPTTVVLDGIMDRLWEVPVPAGNYGNLTATESALILINRETGAPAASATRIVAVPVKNKDIEVATVISGVSGLRVSADGKKLLARQGENFVVLETSARNVTDTAKQRVNLAGLRFAFSPRESWRQMFTDAWRLHRDYFFA
jgi:tricorn protease